MNISVVICSHNPRENHLERTLRALRAQNFPHNCWELLLVDNASKNPLQASWNLSWHVNSRHIREDKLGLTYARLRGIKESTGDLLVFVDDDNVLDISYLREAWQVFVNYPFLGAWGGHVEAEFESPPPPWITDYLEYLAVRDVNFDRWSNLYNQSSTQPYGAGMCVRREVASLYATVVHQDNCRLALGRIGKSLSSGEDLDLALTSLDINLGTGLFSKLRLRHLIPASRATESYLLQLVQGISYSCVILHWGRRRDPGVKLISRARRPIGQIRRALTMRPRRRRLLEAILRGQQDALRHIQRLQISESEQDQAGEIGTFTR